MLIINLLDILRPQTMILIATQSLSLVFDHIIPIRSRSIMRILEDADGLSSRSVKK